MNNRLEIGALLFLVIAAVITTVLLFGATEREQAAIEQLGTDLYELAQAVCAINGGTLEPVEVDGSGQVIAADCVVEEKENGNR